MSDPVATEARPTVEQLGTVQREFRPSAGGVIGGLAVTGFLALIFIITAAGGGPNSVVYVAGLVICLLVALGLIVSLFLPRTSVVQHANGLALYRRKELVAAVPWDRVAHVTQAITRIRVYFIPVRTLYRYAIRTVDGRSFVFTNRVSHVKDLGERIQQAAFPLILARNQAAFNAGQPIQFGKLGLSQAGLRSGSSTIPWSELSGARIGRGRIYIRKSGRWLSWANQRVAQTPDALVLITLVNNLSGQRAN